MLGPSTAGVALAGLLSALRITGGKLSYQRILFLGAGSAEIGIANLFQRPYAHPHPPSTDFVEVIRSLRPTAIIGVSTKGKAFTREVVQAMAELNQRPVIFALSNPTDKAECTAEEALSWSEGRALYTAGVQFPPVRLGDRTYVTGQANNLYIFPAIGLAVFATRATRVPDELFVTAASAVADQVTQAELDTGLLYPPRATSSRPRSPPRSGCARSSPTEAWPAWSARPTSAPSSRPSCTPLSTATRSDHDQDRSTRRERTMAGNKVPIGTGATGTRIERDSMGQVEVPADFDRIVDPRTMVGNPRHDLGLGSSA